MPTATVTSKGQTTIPVDIRRQLGVKPGTRIEFVLDPDGTVRLLPATRSITELRGRITPGDRLATLDEIDAALRNRAVQHHTDKPRSK